MDFNLEAFTRNLTDPGQWARAAGAGIGQAATQIPEQLAFNNARGVFGTLSRKGELTVLQMVARGAFFVAEVGLGLVVAADGADDFVGSAGLGFAGAAVLHAGIDAKDQFVGTGPVLGIQWG